MRRAHGVTPGRAAALRVLTQVGRGRRLDLALGEALDRLGSGEAGWVHELTYGAIRFRGRLDYLLDLHLHQGLESLEPRVLDVLRLGAQQILHMGGVPAYAAVSQACEQARAVSGEGAAGLVNAVLRAMSRAGGGPERFPGFDEDPTGYLATWGSHPRWLVERWLTRWSPDQVRALVEWNNRVPPVFLRPLALGDDEALGRLARVGIEGEAVGRGTRSIRLPAGVDPARALEAVPGVVQDPAATLVTRFVAAEAGQPVADLCAAPGGKALVMAGDGAHVLAVDRSWARCRILRRNAARLGFVGEGSDGDRLDPPGPGGRLMVARALAQTPPVSAARVVLVDVPCSGTGTFRRNPDARWRLDPEEPGRLAQVQEGILEGAARAVAGGGVLVYATCSLEPEENEGPVDRFLSRNPDFRPDPPPEGMPEEFVDGRGLLRILPQVHGLDGAFAARLRRVG